MTVRDLRKRLRALDQDSLIVLSKDGEGNSFSPVPDKGFCSAGKYYPGSTWHGEFDENSDPQEPPGSADHQPEGGVDCIVLWPTN